MNVHLYGRCEPMCAVISERQCAINKERGMFSCERCSGLTGLTEVKIGEEAIMGRQICKVEGCEKQAQQDKDGMCRSHWREATGTPRLKPGIKPSAQRDVSPADTKERQSRDTGLNKAQRRGLTELLTVTGLTVSIPPSLADRMAAADVTANDIIELVEMLLAGQLRKAA